VKSGTKPNLPHSSSAEDEVHATTATYAMDANQRIVRVYQMTIRPPTREHWPRFDRGGRLPSNELSA
jgi:hypothetical protein